MFSPLWRRSDPGSAARGLAPNETGNAPLPNAGDDLDPLPEPLGPEPLGPALETVAVERISRTQSSFLLETHDSAWLFNAADRQHMEGHCPVYKVSCLRGPCRGASLIIKHASDPIQTRSLLHEGQVIAAAAEHDNIVKLAYPCITDGFCAFLVQSRPTGNLAHLADRFAVLHSSAALTWTPLLDVAFQAFLAVQCMHRLDLVHSNVTYACVHYHDTQCNAVAPVIRLAGLDMSIPPGTFALAQLNATVLVAPEARAGVYRADFPMDVYAVANMILGFFCQVFRPVVSASGGAGGGAGGGAAPQRADTAAQWLPQSIAAVLSHCVQHDAGDRCSATDAAAAFGSLLNSRLASQLCGM